ISYRGSLRNISGDNSWGGNIANNGGTRINSDAGTLTINGNITSGANNLYFGGDGTVDVRGTIAGTLTNGNGALYKNWAGTLRLSGNNAETLTGLVMLRGGKIELASDGALGRDGIVDITNGVTVSSDSSATRTILNHVWFATNGTTILGNATKNGLLIFGGSRNFADSGATTIQVESDVMFTDLWNASSTWSTASTRQGDGKSYNNGHLIKTGAGTLIIDSDELNGGQITVSAGVLNIRNNGALGTTGGPTVVSSGAALELQGNIAVGTEALTLSGDGPNLGGAMRNISGNNSYAGGIGFGAATRINSDSGLLTISGGVGGGQAITLGGSGNISISGGLGGLTSLTKDGTGTATLSGGNSGFANVIYLNQGKISVSSDANLGSTTSTTARADRLTFAGGTLQTTANFELWNGKGITLNAGGGTVEVNSGTTLTFGIGTPTHDYSGGLTITAGTLQIGGSNRFLSGNLLVNGGILDISTYSDDLSAVTLSSGSIVGTTGVLTGSSYTLEAGSVSAVLAGTAKVNQGTLLLGGAERLSNTGVLTNNGGTFDLGGYTETVGAVSIKSGTISNGTLTGASYAGESGTVSAVLAGTGALTKTTTGTLILSGANTYSGVATVSAGVLNIQNASALGNLTGGTSVSTGAALEIQGGITVGAEALTLNGDGISYRGSLRNISGDNSWGGNIANNGGTRINSDAG
ncbi:MAG: hypothetical protein EBS49_06925, partial [Verrucomicrobia bacterium]|nr:hypothetical protein [Verrucomicrobiota bacterium]